MDPIEMVKRAAARVSNRYYCHGTHEGSLIGGAFNQFLAELSDLEDAEAEEIAALGDPRGDLT